MGKKLSTHVLHTNLNTHCLLSSQAPKALLEKHYCELSDKPFYTKLVEYMNSGPVVAMVSQ